MIVFYILLLLPMMIQHFVVGNKIVDLEKKNKRALLFFFLCLATLLSLRHENVGNDTLNYINYFNKYAKLNWSQLGDAAIEIGFSFYSKVVSLFTSNPQVFLTVTAIITCALIYPTYKRLNVDSSLAIVIFSTMSTFVVMFSGLRQMLAVGIGMIAYDFVRKKKLIGFVISVAFAMTFHISAVMLAFMYPLYHAKITKKWLLFVVPAMTFVFVFNRRIFSYITLLLEHYINYDTSITQTGAYTMIILFVMFAVFSFLIPDESKLDSETIGLRNFLLFSLVLQMFAPLHTVVMRMNYYYIIFIPLLIPKIVQLKNERWKQFAVVGRHVMVLFFLLYFFVSARGGTLHVFPYHFFWESL